MYPAVRGTGMRALLALEDGSIFPGRAFGSMRAAGGEVVEPHTHVHRHEALVHAHPHVPDLHHRHEHPAG